MFVCERCHKRQHKKSGYDVHFSGSYGPCEDCGKVAECHDCRCYRNVPPTTHYAQGGTKFSLGPKDEWPETS